MFEKWLRCSFVKGMFSDELAIVYNGASFFIPKKFIKTEHADRAKVRVRVFQGDDATWAELPTEDRATIAVEPQDLVAA